jgi:hypothetical protein
MIERLAAIALGALLCTVASAQSIDDRINDMERRIEQLEKRLAQPAAPVRSANPATTRPDGWRQRDNWRALRRGMTESEVRSLLGEPSKVNAFGSLTVWEYPGEGRAQLGRDGKLEGWGEPR